MKRVFALFSVVVVLLVSGCQKGNSGIYETGQPSESNSADERSIINVACVENYAEFDAYANEFNLNQSEYSVNLIDYAGDKGDEFNYINQLHLDIVSGKAPDVIIASNDDAINTLIPKGAFADLYKFLDSDSEVSRDALLPNILKAMETDGKLYSLTEQFGVRTLGVKQSRLNKQGWTMDELIEYYQTLPEDTVFSYYNNTKQGMFSGLFLDRNYVDYNHFSCDFTSESFLRFLEFCNLFPDTDNGTEPEPDCIGNDNVLCAFLHIADFREYGSWKMENFGDEICFIGYPCEDGNGGYIQSRNRFSVLSSSDNKEGAWEFVRCFFTEKYQNSIYRTGLPVRESSYKLITENSMSDRQLYVLPDGTQEYIQTEEPVLSAEEYAYFDNYVRSLNKLTGSSYNTELKSICAEEANSYFSGIASAEKTAETIQSRVTIMLSEKS